MIVRKAFKYRVKNGQESVFRQFCRHAGSARFVWNKALSLQKKRLGQGMRCLSYEDMAKELILWKREFPFLTDAPSQALQQRLMDLSRAIKDAFDKKSPKRFPVFKKKHKDDSFRCPQGFTVVGNRIFVPKTGWIRFHNSRAFTGKPKNVTVSRRGSSWFVSVQTEEEVTTPVHSSSTAVGADLGVKNTIALSDGTRYMQGSSMPLLLAKLANAQRKLARQVKRSSNWKKQKRKIRAIHMKVADMRLDNIHKVSHEISKNHAVIVMEDLNVRNMTRSAKGTLDNPGRNVRQKAELNRAILNQGWSELRRQLLYKAAWRGGSVLFVDPKHTSQECPACLNTSPLNRKTQALFLCTECGHTDNADVNAAVNILRRAGHARMVCESNGAVMPSEAETDKVAA